MRPKGKHCVGHKTLVCDPRPSENSGYKAHKIHDVMGTLWNPEEGLGSRISLLGWLRAQWSRLVRVQELEAEGI